MAREAIARLYDVDKNSLTYTKPEKGGKYRHGTIDFRAKESKLVALDKIFESVWATRLSRGTGSALVHLDVTVRGSVSVENGQTIVTVPDTQEVFVLVKQNSSAETWDEFSASLSRGERFVTVTGRLDGWKGGWTGFLNKPRPKSNRILLTDFTTSDEK